MESWYNREFAVLTSQIRRKVFKPMSAIVNTPPVHPCFADPNVRYRGRLDFARILIENHEDRLVKVNK